MPSAGIRSIAAQVRAACSAGPDSPTTASTSPAPRGGSAGAGRSSRMLSSASYRVCASARGFTDTGTPTWRSCISISRRARASGLPMVVTLLACAGFGAGRTSRSTAGSRPDGTLPTGSAATGPSGSGSASVRVRSRAAKSGWPTACPPTDCPATTCPGATCSGAGCSAASGARCWPAPPALSAASAVASSSSSSTSAVPVGMPAAEPPAYSSAAGLPPAPTAGSTAQGSIAPRSPPPVVRSTRSSAPVSSATPSSATR